MRPRPAVTGKVSVRVAVENLISSQLFGDTSAEMWNKTTSFNSGNEQGNLSSNDVSMKPDFELSDCKTERRLNTLNFMETNVCLQNEKNRRVWEKKLIIDPELGKRQFPSALKIPNSPSSPTDGSKKSVRFADSIGLDLVHVKLFKNDILCDEFFDLEYLLPSLIKPKKTFMSSTAPTSTRAQQRQLSMRFPQRTKEEINQIVEARNVCIESFTCNGMFVSGLIQVKNIAYEKQVRIRYTLDGWWTYAEMPCLFMASNVADNRDTFIFSLCLPLDLPVGSCCEICVCYCAAEQTFWDNNNGENYKLDCYRLPTRDSVNQCNLQSRSSYNAPAFTDVF